MSCRGREFNPSLSTSLYQHNTHLIRNSPVDFWNNRANLERDRQKRSDMHMIELTAVESVTQEIGNTVDVTCLQHFLKTRWKGIQEQW